MTTLLYCIGALIVIAAIYPVIPIVLRVWRRYRGARVITCPETQRPAAVHLDTRHVAFTTLTSGAPHLRLSDCTRWPERRNCGQECLRQIEASPEDCLVRTMLTHWYEGKACVFCGKALDHLDWLQHRPALRSPDRVTREWSEVPAETLPDVLATHQPVCWDCHIAESFRREHPDLVTDRSPQSHHEQR